MISKEKKMEKNITEKIKEGIVSEIINAALEILSENFKESDFNFAHSLRVGLILKEMRLEEEMIAAGILHQTTNKKNLEKINQKSQLKIKRILRGFKKIQDLTKRKKYKKPQPIKRWQKVFLDEQSENLRRMFFAITKDLRPIFLKLAHSLDEMRNPQMFDEKERLKIAQESLEIFSPLAYGLGTIKIKGELEDLAFPYLYPKQYEWLLKNIGTKYEEREKYLQKVQPILIEILANNKINPLDISSRTKHYFSLYQKLLRHDMDIDKIYDLVALRIIVPDIEQCYRTLGVIHKHWKALPGRIKDFISFPKPNGYRSLHTTVLCEEEKITEFQIRTLKMHEEAEYGIAAHLKYKETIPEKTYREHFYWLDKLRKWKEETRDVKGLSERLKFNLFKNQVFVFTPKGDIINLPRGSTPVDFAYAIHTEIGDHCAGARVKGKIIPLQKPLKNAEMVEILTDKNKTPSSDWLRFAKSEKARGKIKTFLEKVYGISFEKPKKKISLREKVSLIKKILPLKRKKKEEVLVAGQTGISVKFSKCCTPGPEDEILAFLTKGEGASLHKTNCQNLEYLKQKWPQKIVQASWVKSEKSK